MSEHRISFVLPAYDEEGNIEAAIAACTRVGQRLFVDHEIIVVDDGSRDATAEKVRALAAVDARIELIQHGHNRGYGEALRTGFGAARMELVFLTDADNQYEVDELERFLPWIERVDAVVGYRVDRQDAWLRRLLAYGWNLLMRLMFYVPARDIDCAFKLFRRSVFDAVDLSAVGAMVSTELMVRIGRAGLGVLELPVAHLPRTRGRARGAHPRVIALAVRELWSMRRDLRELGGSGLPRGLFPTRPMHREGDDPDRWDGGTRTRTGSDRG